MKDEIVIKSAALTKKYKGTTKNALTKLDLCVKKGEVYGFLGPNGAGKSTTIRLFMNFLMPTDGEVYILGQKVGDNPKLYSKIGYLSGDFVAYPKLTGSEFLKYMSELNGTKNTKRISELAKLLEIDLSKKISSLSKGNRQKIGLIQAFMHSPDVLILDEPTSGLDPLKQEVFYELINNSQRNGTTIFVSSHNLNEVQKMCDRVGIIRDGKLVHESDITNLELEAAQTLEITFATKPKLSDIKKIAGVKHAQLRENILIVHVSGEISELLREISQYKVVKLTSKEPDLESEFMRFYDKKLGGKQ